METETDDFETAFTEALGPVDEPTSTVEVGDGNVASPSAATGPAAESKVEAATAPTQTEAGASDAAGDSAATQDATAATETPAPAAAPTTDAVVAPATAPVTQDAILQALAEAVSGVKQPAAPASNAPAATTPAGPVTAADFISQEDRAVVQAYYAEWGEVARGEQILRHAEQQALVQNIYNELSRVITPIVEEVNRQRADAHYNAIRTAHNEYNDNFVADVQKWVATQPTFVRNIYDKILREGTTQEVIELFGVYKSSAAAAASPVVAPVKPAVATPTTVVSAPQKPSLAVQDAAAATAPVGGQRQPRSLTPDANDFGAAWADASRLLN